jgi:hypothetical protein
MPQPQSAKADFVLFQRRIHSLWMAARAIGFNGPIRRLWRRAPKIVRSGLRRPRID